MQDLAKRSWSAACRFHVGDVAWGRYSIPGAEQTFRTSLWSHREEVVAWAWLELPGHLDLLVDPARGDLVPLALDGFEQAAQEVELTSGPELECTVMEADTQVIVALEDRGYVARASGPFFARHLYDLAQLPPVELPAGFSIASADPQDVRRRAAVHRAGWSAFGSRVTADSYADVMRCYPYRSATDLVVVAPDGQWVASALGWYDEVNKVGLVEPVSCAPAFRRLGLARAVNVALLHVFRELGGISATVLPRGDDAYPAPGLLYRSIGYRPGARTVSYARRCQ